MSNISCLIGFVGLSIIMYGVWRITRPKTSRTINNNSNTAENQHSKKPNWAWPIIIAILLAFWSVIFALFFLAIIWIMRLNPKADSKEIPFPSEKDRKRARGTYIWLLLSPFLNVIVLLIGVFNSYSSRTPTNEWVLIALLPLVFHLPVLARLDSNSPFVFRHTQQAIFLLALRASMTSLALNIGSSPDDGILLFLFGNGFLWLVGSIWGLNQANHGKCWWIGRKGEKVLSKDAVPTEKPVSRDKMEKPIPNEELGELLKSLNAEGSNARQIALNAFRQGTPETRKKAVTVLSKLGEVEKF